MLTTDELIARAEITDVIQRLARGTDRLDRELMASCYHSDGFDDHNSFRGSGVEFTDWVCTVLPHFAATTHFIALPHIRLDGDVAQVDTYCVAHHVSRADESGQATDMVMALRYVDRFEKRKGVWKISHRTGMTDWTRLEAPSSAGFGSIADAQLGKRGKKDMVYRARQLYL